MADVDLINSDASTNCTRCKNPARTGIRCIRCGKVSHKSCLKIMKNVKFLDDDNVICCAAEVPDNLTDLQVNAAPSKENIVKSVTISDDVDKIRISYLEEIICLKDLIINNQALAITALTDQIALLKDSLSRGLDQLSNDLPHSVIKHSNIKSVDRATSSSTSTASPVISQKTVANAIHNAKALTVCTETINLENDTIKQPQHKSSNKTRARKILIGKQENSLCPFKAAETRPTRRIYEYHVTNLNPDTDVAALCGYLKGFAPNVIVDKLNSKNPQRYSSFKVAVPEDESVCILNSSIWPQDVIVNRFFRSKGSRSVPRNQTSSE